VPTYPRISTEKKGGKKGKTLDDYPEDPRPKWEENGKKKLLFVQREKRKVNALVENGYGKKTLVILKKKEKGYWQRSTRQLKEGGKGPSALQVLLAGPGV